MENGFHLIAFENTHTAMTAQKLLKPNYKFQVIPTLREITLSCGISIMLPDLSRDTAIDIVKGLKLEDGLYHLYEVVGEKSERIITQLL